MHTDIEQRELEADLQDPPQDRFEHPTKTQVNLRIDVTKCQVNGGQLYALDLGGTLASLFIPEVLTQKPAQRVTFDFDKVVTVAMSSGCFGAPQHVKNSFNKLSRELPESSDDVYLACMFYSKILDKMQEKLSEDQIKTFTDSFTYKDMLC